MIKGEIIAKGHPWLSPGTKLEVLLCGAGWYIGYLDRNGEPYSRESKYFTTYEEAEKCLEGM